MSTQIRHVNGDVKMGMMGQDWAGLEPEILESFRPSDWVPSEPMPSPRLKGTWASLALFSFQKEYYIFC